MSKCACALLRRATTLLELRDSPSEQKERAIAIVKTDIDISSQTTALQDENIEREWRCAQTSWVEGFGLRRAL